MALLGWAPKDLSCPGTQAQPRRDAGSAGCASCMEQLGTWNCPCIPKAWQAQGEVWGAEVSPPSTAKSRVPGWWQGGPATEQTQSSQGCVGSAQNSTGCLPGTGLQVAVAMLPSLVQQESNGGGQHLGPSS